MPALPTDLEAPHQSDADALPDIPDDFPLLPKSDGEGQSIANSTKSASGKAKPPTGTTSSYIVSPQLAAAFFALISLQVCVALSFKFAQEGPDNSYPFSPLAMMVIAEFAKFLLSLALFSFEVSTRQHTGGATVSSRETACGKTYEELRNQISSSLVGRISLLALLYCINNSIAFQLFRVADGANINLIKSGSSFLSALLLCCSLGRPIARIQWSAICLQVAGLVVAQFGANCTNVPMLPLQAYGLLLVSLLISTGCGVWNDHMLKDVGETSMHTVNMVLYLAGTLLNGVGYMCSSRSDLGFFSGFNKAPTYLILLCQTFFGISISAVYKYSDATVKTFANSCATSVLLMIDFYAFGKPFSLVVTMGCITVFAATHLYVTNPPVNPRNASHTKVAPTKS